MGFFLGCRKFIIADADATKEADFLPGDLRFGDSSVPLTTCVFLVKTAAFSEHADESEFFLFFVFNGSDEVLVLPVDEESELVFVDGALAAVAGASLTGSFFACKQNASVRD